MVYFELIFLEFNFFGYVLRIILRRLFYYSIILLNPQGGYLVLGAVCFHGILMAMLYRPLFLHYKFVGKKG